MHSVEGTRQIHALMPTIACLQNVINQFTAIGSDPRVSFYGNVTLGRDVSLAELRRMYRAVGSAFVLSDRQYNCTG